MKQLEQNQKKPVKITTIPKNQPGTEIGMSVKTEITVGTWIINGNSMSH